MLAEPPLWIPARRIVETNRILVAQTGEPFAIAGEHLLERALAKPRHLWAFGEDDPAALAGALLFAIARNRPFAHANKRTGWLAAMAFLDLNGFAFVGPDRETVAEAVVAVVEDRLREEDFTKVMRRALAPI